LVEGLFLTLYGWTTNSPDMVRVRLLKVRVHAYATEDLEKVRRAVENTIGLVDATPAITHLEGYHGDRIAVLEYVVKDEVYACRLLRDMVSRLGSDGVGVEEKSRAGGVIHVRLDKQAACMGEMRYGEMDAIKLEFSYEGDYRELLG
jgi:RNA binding exosome subunit